MKDEKTLPEHVREFPAARPTTLRFERRDDDACTEMLVSELWPSAHRLKGHGETEVRFTPQRAGRYAFTCGMGMYQGADRNNSFQVLVIRNKPPDNYLVAG